MSKHQEMITRAWQSRSPSEICDSTTEITVRKQKRTGMLVLIHLYK